MPVKILLPILATDCHYHNSGPEKMRTANSKFFLGTPYPIYIARGPLFSMDLKKTTNNSFFVTYLQFCLLFVRNKRPRWLNKSKKGNIFRFILPLCNHLIELIVVFTVFKKFFFW